ALETEKPAPAVDPRRGQRQGLLRLTALPDQARTGNEPLRKIGEDLGRDLAREAVGPHQAGDPKKRAHGCRRRPGARGAWLFQSRTRMTTRLPRAVAAADTNARSARMVRPSRPIRRPRSASGTSTS